MEIELKLEISRNDIEALDASGVFGEPSTSGTLRSIYFDTRSRQLVASGFTLRIRHNRSARVQTVKASGAAASLFARSEWETPVTGDTPVLDATSPIGQRFDIVASDLFAQFEVETDRRTWNITENGSQIEVAIDRCTIRAGDRSSAFSEVEFELKDGNPADLFVLARKVEAIVPVKFSVVSKAGRGFRLLDALPDAVKAIAPDLEGRDPAIRTFQSLAWTCFKHFRLNETILLQTGHADALHQSRVALRRLRSAFSIYKPVVEGAEPLRLTAEFRWLAAVLGEVRNIDVLLSRTDDRNLHAALTTARAAAYRDACDALNSRRAAALMLDFNQWLMCDEAFVSGLGEGGDKTTALFAGQALDRMRRKLKKHGQNLAKLDDDHRHQVRKDAKKLRYTAEFFRSLYDDKRGERRARKFIAAMEELQAHLGTLNDLVTSPGVLETHGLSDHPAARHVLARDNKKELLAKAQTALDDVLDAKRFWR